MRQRCRGSYVTGASNWYCLTVGQGLLSLQQVRVEGGVFISSVSSLPFIFLPPLSLSFISSANSRLSFPGRRHKITHKGWRVVKPQQTKEKQSNQLPLSLQADNNASQDPPNTTSQQQTWQNMKKARQQEATQRINNTRITTLKLL